jgi:hypothetical protein
MQASHIILTLTGTGEATLWLLDAQAPTAKS